MIVLKSILVSSLFLFHYQISLFFTAIPAPELIRDNVIPGKLFKLLFLFFLTLLLSIRIGELAGRAEVNRLVSSVAPHWWATSDDPSAIEAAREALANEIVKLSTK
jgi:hypothetical protein